MKNFKLSLIVFLPVVLLLMFSQALWAEDVPEVAQPGTVEKSFQKETLPPQSQLPKIEVMDQETGTLKGGEGVTFELKSIVFEGNEIFPDDELKQAVEGYLDKVIEVNKLEEIADALTSYYIKNGYILTRAYLPPQTIKDGQVLIRIREGRMGKVIVRGNDRYKKEIIENVVMVMKKKGAVKTADLERSLLLLMDYPGLTVKATLVAGKEPGTTDVIVDVKETRLVGAGVDYNNYGSEYVGQHRFSGNVSLYNPSGRGDYLNANIALGVNSGDLTYGRLEYTYPILYCGTRLGLNASRLQYEGGQELEVLDLQGKTTNYGIWVSHPFIRTRNMSLWGDLGFEYKRAEVETLGFIEDEDKIATARLGGTLDWIDKSSARNVLSAKLIQGLDNEELKIRFDSQAKFTKMEMRFNRFQQYPNFYDLNTIISLTGQVAIVERLPSSEMISIGGADSVRGYDQSEVSGDSGAYGTFELRVPLWKKNKLDWSVLDTKGCVLQAATFIDFGAVRKVKADVSEINDADMIGAGLGLRFALSPYIQAKLDYGKSISGEEPIDNKGKIYLQLSAFY